MNAPTTLTLAVYNLRNGTPWRLASPAAADVLEGIPRGHAGTFGPDVTLFLEGDTIKHPAALHALAARGRHGHPLRFTDGGGLFWRPDVLELVHLAHPLAAAGRRVGYVPGRRTVLPDYRLAVARFDSAGGPLSVVKGHSPAHNRWGGPRARMWAEWEHAAADVLQAEHAHHGGPVYLGADMNRPVPRGHFPGLRVAGARSCWDDMRHPPATRGRETIDAWWVLGPGAFTDAHVPRLGHNPSDHRPVQVTAMHIARPTVKNH